MSEDGCGHAALRLTCDLRQFPQAQAQAQLVRLIFVTCQTQSANVFEIAFTTTLTDRNDMVRIP